LLGEGLVRRGGQAHSVRRESCNADSSPVCKKTGIFEG